MAIDLKHRLHALKGLKLYSRVVYSALSVLFFLANYHICWYFYPLDTAEHIRNWWILKSNIYVLVIAFCYLALAQNKSTNKKILFIERFIVSFGIGFATSNAIDRFVLDNRMFTWSSYYPLIFIALVSYLNVKRITKQAEKFAKELK